MIFLDEPTTGLDSNTAVTIMFLLRDLANNGRTVVSVIHQPSTEIFNKFDRLILLCKGNIIYQVCICKKDQLYFLQFSDKMIVLTNVLKCILFE